MRVGKVLRIILSLQFVKWSVDAKNNELALTANHRGMLLETTSERPDDSTDGEESVGLENESLSFNKRVWHSKEGVFRRASYFLREVKGTHSSEFECALIKGTRPDNHPAKQKHVDRLVETAATFPIAMKARTTPSTDYYQMMLHKLWSCMAEKDWRTVVKAAYVLHRLGVALDPVEHKEFLRRYQLLKKAIHKRSKQKYFSSAILTLCKPEDASFLSFVASYSSFVFARFLLFSGRFEYTERYQARGTISDSLLVLLRDSCRVLELAMRINFDDDQMSEGSDGQEIMCQSLELVVKDVFVSGKSRGQPP